MRAFYDTAILFIKLRLDGIILCIKTPTPKRMNNCVSTYILSKDIFYNTTSSSIKLRLEGTILCVKISISK